MQQLDKLRNMLDSSRTHFKREFKQMSIRKLSKVKGSWDMAIQEAKKQIEKLETALRVFERKKDSGEPWPGDKAA